MSSSSYFGVKLSLTYYIYPDILKTSASRRSKQLRSKPCRFENVVPLAGPLARRQVPLAGPLARHQVPLAGPLARHQVPLAGPLARHQVSLAGPLARCQVPLGWPPTLNPKPLALPLAALNPSTICMQVCCVLTHQQHLIVIYYTSVGKHNAVART